ncbi:major facilitator superfamily domain-containing protein [Aspergillus karnatakaensis]|uniref:major facilitator superfamily domain-containing protein n=1 Tax=Aspergillus karnatakaensis TaxID=1810916 RepID=UPI003CCE365B
MKHWVVLAAVGSINWGTYFIYDIPAALSTPLSEHLSLSDHQFAYLISLLYTVYAAPNTVLPFFSSAAVQRFGERRLLIVIVSAIVFGQLLFALAVHARFQLGLVIGRALLGLGGEVVGVLGVEIVTRWFQDRRLSLALALNLGAGRLGSVANTVIVPRLIDPYGVVAVTWIATVLTLGVCIVGLVSLFAVTGTEHQASASAKREDEAEDEDAVPSFPFRAFPPVFWYLAVICLLGYGCLNAFTNSAQRFLATRFYEDDQRAAGSAMSILFIFSGLLVPTFGFLLDNLHPMNLPRALVVSNILLLLGHFTLLSSATDSPLPPLSLLGAADALLTVAFWASVARCLLILSSPAHRPLLSSKDALSMDGYQSIPSAPEPTSPRYLFTEDEEANTGPDSIPGETIRTLGIGIMTSLINIATAVVPLPLAVVETLTGFAGVEGVFLGLAGAGGLVCLRLAWIYRE